MPELAATAAPIFPSWKEAQRQALSVHGRPGRAALAGTAAPAARPAPRYVGSLTEMHGDVVDVRACVLSCCIGRPEWEHPHASLTVYPDAGGSAVRLDRVRFESFTGRP